MDEQVFYSPMGGRLRLLGLLFTKLLSSLAVPKYGEGKEMQN